MKNMLKNFNRHSCLKWFYHLVMSSNALNEEIEALKSIFEKDLVYNDSKITITLFPLQEKEKKEIHVQVDLCVDCLTNYPLK